MSPRPDGRDAGWVPVSRGSLRPMLLLVAGLSVGIALFIALPMTELFDIALDVQPPFGVGWLSGAVVVAILLGPVMLPRASRSLAVDARGGRLRVGRRVIAVEQVRHAYRIPDGIRDGRFQLRLGVPGGLDAVVGVSSKQPAELSRVALDALLDVLERAPIEPDPAFPVRPPLGDELGVRDAAQQVTDRVDRALLAFETFGFAKPSLLAELAASRGTFDDDPAGPIVHDLGVVAPGTTHAPELQATVREAVRSGTVPSRKRGFFSLARSAYRRQLAAVETWLRSATGAELGDRGGLWWFGLGTVVVALAGPWVWFGVFIDPSATLAVGSVIGISGLFGFGAITLLTWPFFAWLGLLLMWKARLIRYERARSAAIRARQAGVPVPEEVARFFGPQYPELSYRSGLYLTLLVMSVLLLAGGLTAIAVGFGQVENWDASWVPIALGALMIAGSPPLFFRALRISTHAPALVVRANVTWHAISGDLR